MYFGSNMVGEACRFEVSQCGACSKGFSLEEHAGALMLAHVRNWLILEPLGKEDTLLVRQSIPDKYLPR